jgi:hypothetical protein
MTCVWAERENSVCLGDLSTVTSDPDPLWVLADDVQVDGLASHPLAERTMRWFFELKNELPAEAS